MAHLHMICMHEALSCSCMLNFSFVISSDSKVPCQIRDFEAASPACRIHKYPRDMYCWSGIDYVARHVFVAVEFLRMVEAMDQDFMSLNIALVSSALIRTAAYMQVVQC
jgi:hypothetical protein